MEVVTIYDLIIDSSKQVKLKKNRNISFDVEKLRIDEPGRAVEVFRRVFNIDNLTEEYVFLMCTDAEGDIKGMFEVSHGSISKALINIRGIFQRALLCNATNLIVAHNHPSGGCKPSNEDIRSYKGLVKAGKIMEIEVLDNLIIGNGYYSFKENDIDS